MGMIFWMVLALVAGAAIPLNGAFNARLGAAIASPIHASARKRKALPPPTIRL